MSNAFFQFKQFTVFHDRCAMKVGTDGVLLGAWASLEESDREVLDVGTGTGLIALQLAQRSAQAHITALEIEPEAALQARENVTASPWEDRIEVVCQDFRYYQPHSRFDLIVSNPPYFVDALRCPDPQRSMARHSGELNYDLLCRRSAHLLADCGRLCLVIPSEAEKLLLDCAWEHHLFPWHRTRVFTKSGKPCRRVLLAFGLQESPCQEEELCIEHPQGGYTDEYRELTKEFYLKF